MSAHLGQPRDDRSLVELHAQLIRFSRYAGLARFDAEDVAQDIWIWMLREKKLNIARSDQWVRAVVKNFVLRYRRRIARLAIRESQAFETSPDEGYGPERLDIETQLSVLSVERRLPRREARLLHELRLGATWPEATERVGVPNGSRDWLRKRLAQKIRAAFSPGSRTPRP